MTASPASTKPPIPHQPDRADRRLPPHFTGDPAADAELLTRHLAASQEQLDALPGRSARTPTQQEKAAALQHAGRLARHRFLHLHTGHVHDELTDGRSRLLRVDELAFAAAERYPGLVPTRARIAADRQVPQAQRSGVEVDQGIFFSHVLRVRESGEHLLLSMLAPTARALALRAEFERTGHADLGRASVQRDGRVAHVTICNQDVLNAEDDAVVEDLETAVDLALLDDQVAVGVLRGAVLSHPRHRGRRAFGAGINLTHLYQGRIGFVDFMLRRELGYIRKLMHGLHLEEAHDELIGPTGGKPWIGAIDSFAIGGATQVALVLDRVIAASDAYFSLPALNEGIVPGAANLRLGRLVGDRMAHRMIFFGQEIAADSQAALALCDEVVAPDAVDAAVAAAAARLDDPAVLSNRRMSRLGQESDDAFRAYMSRYALEQSVRLHSPDVVAKLERTWLNRRRRPSVG